VRATLTNKMVDRPGIYNLSWAVLDENGRPVAVDRGIMTVERSLFPLDEAQAHKDAGPPSLQEIRMRLMDSSPSENMLLDDVEFKDEQILLAIFEPVRYWNETPPPIRKYNTRTFPFRGAWVTGIMAQLHMMAAAHYRRNVLRSAVGGGSDLDREREYMAEGMRLWQEYQAWVSNKKVELNLKLFSGQSISPYSGLGRW